MTVSKQSCSLVKTSAYFLYDQESTQYLIFGYPILARYQVGVSKTQITTLVSLAFLLSYFLALKEHYSFLDLQVQSFPYSP